jgi:peptidoglycan/LPS O-acetylase OafA/YrhL
LNVDQALGHPRAPSEAAQPPAGFTRVPALDGVRAIAIVAVLLFHHYQFDSPSRSGWAGGFLGVDVFFVLSGFLITSLLLHEHGRNHRIDLPRFWSRRARRLLPALLALIVVEAVLARFVLDPVSASRLRGEGIATLLYVENWHRIWKPPSGLSHTWSLSVEEQWYLVFPVLLVFVLARSQGQVTRILRPLALLAVSSALACALLFHGIGERSYYGTDTRAQSLLVGAVLAVLLYARSPRHLPLKPWVGWIALGLLVWMFYVVRSDDARLYEGGFALVAIAAAILITAIVQSETSPLARVFSWRPLVAVGLISYGLYLYHYPVYLWLTPERTHLTTFELFLLRATVTAAAAVISYHLIEKRFRRMQHFGRKQVLGFAAAGVGALALLYAATPSGVASPIAKSEAALALQRTTTPTGVERFFVVGDETAFELALHSPFDDDSHRGSAYGLLGCDVMNGDPVIDGKRLPRGAQCSQLLQSFARLTRAYRPQTTMLILGPEEARERFIGDRRFPAESRELQDAVVQRVDAARRALTQTGAKFVLLSPQCDPVSDVPPSHVAWLQQTLAEYARRHRSDVDYREVTVRRCGTSSPTDPRSTWKNIALLLQGT